LKKLSLLFAIVFTLLFAGCSSKEVFQPKLVKDDWEFHGSSTEKIVDVSSDVAMLESRKVLLKDKLIDTTIEESYRLLGSSDGWVLSSTIDGQLIIDFISDKSMKKKFNLKKTIAGASIKDDVLAVLFADNEMALYSISKKSLLVKVQGSAPIVVDSRIVNPYFMNDLVLFLTLDGKVVIVNSKLKKKLRTTIVSSEDNFNNVIYFNVVDNKLIAATGNKLLSMAAKEIRVSYEIRNIAYSGKDIFITTKQGEVISLTPDLQVNAKVKFPFAHFLGLIIHNDKVYALEKEGYLIEISKDLLNYSVYEVDIEDGYIFVADKMFYIDDEYISLEQ
jgi:outer membrane murein-binding lipoprotein Lpp